MSPDASATVITAAPSCSPGQYIGNDGNCVPDGEVLTPTQAVTAAPNCVKLASPVFFIGLLDLILMVACIVVIRQSLASRKAFDQARRQYEERIKSADAVSAKWDVNRLG